MKKYLGKLRCLTCGGEHDRQADGLTHGRRLCCGVPMVVVSEAQLREEREFGERMEEEEAFIRAAANNG